jgi:AcrR family transcriptional regulator
MNPPRQHPSPPLQDHPPGPFAPLAPPTATFLFDAALNGRDRFPREVLDRNHRNRVLTGAVAAVAEHGYPDTSIERIIVAAGVSRYTFYAQFPDKEACLLAAYDRGLAWLEEEVTVAVLGAGDWAEKIRAATVRLLALLSSDPGLARLLATEILCLGPPGQARRRELVDRLVPLLLLGRAAVPDRSASPATLERFLVHGAITVVDREVAAGRGEHLGELTPDLTEYFLVPYLGHVRARRVAGARSRPSAR